jgi:hypothetical protein
MAIVSLVLWGRIICKTAGLTMTILALPSTTGARQLLNGGVKGANPCRLGFAPWAFHKRLVWGVAALFP